MFVDLAPIADSDLVLTAVARSLGVRDVGGRPVFEVLARSLADRAVLLVLDNYEHVLSSAPALVTLLDGNPALAMLVTSREPLRVRGEQVHPVAALPIPTIRDTRDCAALLTNPSVALFEQGAREATSEFRLTSENAAAVAELCTRLDGLPLAIELAAARARSLSPQSILDRLGQRLDLLASGRLDDAERHGSLRAAIDWTYDQLTAPERHLFERLSLFVGGWTLEAAEAVCADDRLPQTRIADILARLVDRSLVVTSASEGGAIRYGLLETMRQYAGERLERRPLEALKTRERHVAWSVALADGTAAARHAWGDALDRWLDDLEREHENLRAALRYAADRTDPTIGLRLAGALAMLWHLRGHLAEGRAWLATLLAQPVAPDATAVRALALAGAAQLAYAQGDLADADALAEEALTLYRAVDEPPGVAVALNIRGLVARNRGAYPVARSLHEQALAIARSTGNRRGEAINLANLGFVAYQEGNYAAARRWAGESVAAARVAGHLLDLSIPLHVLGRAALGEGKFREARRHFEEALAIGDTVGDGRTAIRSFAGLGHAALELGEDAVARARFREGLAHTRQFGFKAGLPDLLEGVAALIGRSGRPVHALQLAGAAASLRAELGEGGFAAERVRLDQWLAPARRVLGGGEADAAWAYGEALGADRAVALARVECDERAPAPPPTNPRTLLTEREEQVADLVAQGLTNRHVSERLVIAEKTAANHVGHILAKLGFQSRSQLAAWVVSRR